MTRRNTRKLLQDGLKELRLLTMRSGFPQVAEHARADSSSYEQFLLTLVDQERDVRRQRRVERALRASHLPLDKTLETFERKRLPRKIDTLVNVLIESSFLDRCEKRVGLRPTRERQDPPAVCHRLGVDLRRAPRAVPAL